MIVVDTNVVSEFARPAPSVAVAEWLADEGKRLAITTVTLAEIRYGIERLPDGSRKRALGNAMDDVLSRFQRDQVLSFDREAAAIYGQLKAQRAAAGQPIAVLDAQIAAICLATGAKLATRNIRDFDNLGLTLVNPWD